MSHYRKHGTFEPGNFVTVTIDLLVTRTTKTRDIVDIQYFTKCKVNIEMRLCLITLTNRQGLNQ